MQAPMPVPMAAIMSPLNQGLLRMLSQPSFR